MLKSVFFKIGLAMVSLMSPLAFGAGDDPLLKMETLSSGVLPPPLKVVGPGPVAGLKEVLLADGTTVFMSDDGRVVIVGSAVNFETKEASGGKGSLLPKTFGDLRGLGGVTFGSGEPGVVVFSDPDCPHCRRLHAELEIVVSKGVAVKILPYSATGGPAKKIEGILCGTDRRLAWDAAIADGGGDGMDCREGELEARAIAATARAMRVTATPTIVYKNGAIVPGFAKAEAIMGRLSEPPANARPAAPGR